MTVFLAHFARVPDFGLYEDDYWSIAPHLYDPVSKLGGLFLKYFSEWPTGRPLNYFLPAALAVMGSKLGGLGGVYALAAAWLVLNAVLVFLIVRQLMSPRAALVAAVSYVLFPADSTKTLLVHAAHIQGAMTFLLVGAWLWVRGGRSRVASYPVAALSLLSYETAFLPFLAVPLLWAAWDRRGTIVTWLRHLVACTLLVALVCVVRLSKGDGRAAEAMHRPSEAVHRMVTSLFIGPFTSGKSLVVAPFAGARHFDGFAALAALVFLVGFAAVWLGSPARNAPAVQDAGPRWPRWLNGPSAMLPWWWLLCGALVAWSGSYALTLVNYPPTQTIGRTTSTHVAAGWPACLAMAALYEGVQQKGAWWRRSAASLFAVWAVLLVGYQQDLQRQYVQAWRVQKSFWRQVMALAPEAGPGWTVITDGPPAEHGAVIGANSWADYLVYRLIFRRGFDAMKGFDAKGPDFAHLGNLGPLVPFRRTTDHVEWKPQFYSGNFVPIDPARLVLLIDDHGSLRRVSELAAPVGNLVSTSTSRGISRDYWPPTPVSRLLCPECSP